MNRQYRKAMQSLILVHILLQVSLLKWPNFAKTFHFRAITYRFLSLLFLLGFYLVFIAFFGSFIYGDFFFKLFFILVAFINMLKILYRQEPIIPYDLQFLKTPFSFFTMVNAVYLLMFAIFLLITYIVIRKVYESMPKEKSSKMLLPKRLMVMSLALIIFVSCLQLKNIEASEFENDHDIYFYHDDPIELYEEKGFVLGFASNLPGESMRRPRDYSQQKVVEIMEKYRQKAIQMNAGRLKDSFDDISIVYILSESLSDPSRVNEVEILGGNPLSYIQNNEDKLERGTMMSPVYGGGTANTEFEVLTGFQTQYLSPNMSTPYLSILPEKEYFPSFVEIYKQSPDKEAIAIHAYHSGMFERRKVYELLGFDQQIYQNGFKHKEKLGKSDYLSDAAAYQEVLDFLRKKDKKDYFIHLITMQNHAKYSDKYDQYHFDVKTPMSKKAQDQIRYYTEGIYETDNATKAFIEEIENLDRKVIVVFYGDHLPSLYYDLKEQNNIWSLSMTDYFIYSNFISPEPKEREEHVSPISFALKTMSYADVKMSPYQALVSEYLKHIPYSKANCFYDQEDNCRHYEALDEETKAILHDYYLIQYDMIEGQQYARLYMTIAD